jgi:DNA-binding NtrC family response regulator
MGNNKIILIAEPRQILSSELEDFLSNIDAVNIQVDSLEKTLLTLQDQRVDALVLDAVLLGDDLGFISIIKGMETDLPIIICAEVNTPAFETRIRQQRIFFYHIKSFGIQYLEMAISNAINK